MQQKNPSIYLSIDLDYWCNHKDPNDSSKQFLKQIAQLNKTVLVVNSHERLLEHINESRCNKLINVDFHSDLTDGYLKTKYKALDSDNNELVFNEGTWGSFVKWQRRGEFVWLYPSYVDCVKKENGLCHSGNNDPFECKEFSKWAKTKRTAFCNKVLEPNIFNNIKKIGICTSHNWLNKKQYDADYLPNLVGAYDKTETLDKIKKRFDHKTKLNFLLK